MWNLQIELIISQAYIAIVHSLNNNIYLKSVSHVTLNMYALLYIVNPLHKHAHFSHILVCVTHFLVTICFNITITLVSSTKKLQNFLSKCDYNERNLGQILRFCKCSFLWQC
jgi:large-conductance mechanosensitive channel